MYLCFHMFDQFYKPVYEIHSYYIPAVIFYWEQLEQVR